MNRAIWHCVLGVALVPLAGCVQDGKAPSSKPVIVYEAQTEIVRQMAFPQVLWVPGQVVPAREVKIASRLDGFVHNVFVHEGDRVHKGQLLAEIDPAETNAAIDKAKASITTATASLNDATEDVERFRKLAKTQALAKDQLRDAQVTAIAARAELERAKAELEVRLAELHYVKLLAPEDAVVVGRLLDPGGLAGTLSPVLLLESLAPREMDVYVPVSMIDSIEIGSSLSVKLDDGAVFPGKVLRIVPSADSATRRVKVRLALHPDISTTTGAYGQAQLHLRNELAIGVSQSAVTPRAGIPGAFVVDRNGIARFRSLELGRVHEGYQLVLSGLLPGDQTILNPTARLHDGHKAVIR